MTSLEMLHEEIDKAQRRHNLAVSELNYAQRKLDEAEEDEANAADDVEELIQKLRAEIASGQGSF